VASAVSLAPEDVATKTHNPQVASVGFPFVIAELRDRSALERARINMNEFEALGREEGRPCVYLYTKVADGFDMRARMFAPASGVPEDPATGGAGCAVAGLLAHYAAPIDGSFRFRIAQGVEMGRPSILLARAQKTEGIVHSTWIGGACVLISEGVIHLN
jgi:trans-2,3-dihydro-3-hydroxyanthranilate isomerase